MSREQKIKEFLETEGLSTLTEIDPNDEGYFTPKGCEICNDHVGNIVFDCNGFNPTTREIQETYQVCFECFYFINYGEEID